MHRRRTSSLKASAWRVTKNAASIFTRGLLSAALAAISGGVLIYVISTVLVTQAQANVRHQFATHIAATKAESLIQATNFTEPGSTAEAYAKILLRLWKAAAASNNGDLSEVKPVTQGSSESKGKGEKVCYSDIEIGPQGCVTLSHFRHGEGDLIRSFAINGVPLEQLVVRESWGADAPNRLLSTSKGDGAYYVYEAGTLVDPDLKHTSVALWVSPGNAEKAADVLFSYQEQTEESPQIVIHDRNENPISGVVRFPERIGYFSAAYAAARIEGVGEGFIYVCNLTAPKGEEVDPLPPRDEADCHWISLPMRG